MTRIRFRTCPIRCPDHVPVRRIGPTMDHEMLWAGFCAPPDEARPRAWWHWMDGNVDPDGIRLDLEWLHRVGVRGVQMFDGGMGTPLVVPERVDQGSPAWREAVRLAAATARRLGLEFAVATSAGWSAAGGAGGGSGGPRGAPGRAGPPGRPVGRAGRRHEEGRLVDHRRPRRAGRGAAAGAAA